MPALSPVHDSHDALVVRERGEIVIGGGIGLHNSTVGRTTSRRSEKLREQFRAGFTQGGVA